MHLKLSNLLLSLTDRLNYEAVLDIFKYLVKDLKSPQNALLGLKLTSLLHSMLFLIFLKDLGQVNKRTDTYPYQGFVSSFISIIKRLQPSPINQEAKKPRSQQFHIIILEILRQET